MLDIEKFAKEMLESQNKGQLTEYCQNHWETMLELMPNGNHDMDTLIEKALLVKGSLIVRSVTDVTLEYWQFINKFKGSDES